MLAYSISAALKDTCLVKTRRMFKEFPFEIVSIRSNLTGKGQICLTLSRSITCSSKWSNNAGLAMLRGGAKLF